MIDCKRQENMSDLYLDLIKECWVQNPEERPSFEEIVKILKDKKIALEEFREKTDIDVLKSS